MNINQIYIGPSNFTELSDEYLDDFFGVYTIVQTQDYFSNSEYSNYSFHLSKDAVSNESDTNEWIFVKSNDGYIYLFQRLIGDTTGSWINLAKFNYSQQNDFDINFPEEFIFEENETLSFEVNDRFYQKQIWATGSSDLSYKITNDVNIKYKDVVSFADSLRLTDKSGWEIDVGDAGEYMFYIDFQGDNIIDSNFIFKEDGPSFEISRQVTLDFIKAKKPDFSFNVLPSIKFKKGDTHISEQSFTNRIYNNISLPEPQEEEVNLNFGDTNWFQQEKYSLTEIPSQELYEQQEDFVEFFGENSKREDIVSFEADADLNLSPIRGLYTISNGEVDCIFNKQLYTIGEIQHPVNDFENNGRRLVSYYTINAFLYNVIYLIKYYNNQNEIKNSAFESFLINKFNTNDYLNVKDMSRYFNNYYRPYIGYSSTCNVLQRRFHYLGGSNIIVEWSIHHDNPTENEKVFDAAYRRFYDFDQTFEYRGVNYSVVEFFPFEDFQMIPEEVVV